MSDIEQFLLVGTILIASVTSGFSLHVILDRKTAQRPKPDDEQLNAWPHTLHRKLNGYWTYHQRLGRLSGRFMKDADGEVFFVCREGATFDREDFEDGAYFRKES
jgi:hypothetical protein